MTVEEIMTELRGKGSESIKKILLNHGVKEPFFGVKVEHLKTIQKKIKKDYPLSKELYATGNADAMYLAGLIADDKKMTPADLQNWVQQAVSLNISEYTVPWVAAESLHGYGLALLWIDQYCRYERNACQVTGCCALYYENKRKGRTWKKEKDSEMLSAFQMPCCVQQPCYKFYPNLINGNTRLRKEFNLFRCFNFYLSKKNITTGLFCLFLN